MSWWPILFLSTVESLLSFFGFLLLLLCFLFFTFLFNNDPLLSWTNQWNCVVQDNEEVFKPLQPMLLSSSELEDLPASPGFHDAISACCAPGLLTQTCVLILLLLFSFPSMPNSSMQVVYPGPLLSSHSYLHGYTGWVSLLRFLFMSPRNESSKDIPLLH